MYGCDWNKLCDSVPSKTRTQIKNYYQNYKHKLGFDKMDLPATAIQVKRMSLRLCTRLVAHGCWCISKRVVIFLDSL